MKIFISYRRTGEDPEELKEVIHNIFTNLEKAGHTPFCSFLKDDLFKKNKFTHKQILEYALNELDKSDICLAFVKSENKSEGMLLEIGYALAKKKKFVLAIKEGVRTVFIREMADQTIEFETLDQLYSKLSKLK